MGNFSALIFPEGFPLAQTAGFSCQFRPISAMAAPGGSGTYNAIRENSPRFGTEHINFGAPPQPNVTRRQFEPPAQSKIDWSQRLREAKVLDHAP